MSDKLIAKRARAENYPFVTRQYHPYKMWLSEVKRQLGEKKKPRVKGKPMTLLAVDDIYQKELF